MNASSWHRFRSHNCYEGRKNEYMGGTPLDKWDNRHKVRTQEQCIQMCIDRVADDCIAVVVTTINGPPWECWLRRAIELPKCDVAQFGSKFDLYMNPTAIPPSPPPAPPSPPHPPFPPPANAVASFIAIGDWGYFDTWRHAEDRLAPGGLTSHPKWNADWRGAWKEKGESPMSVVTTDCQMKLAKLMADESNKVLGTRKEVKFVVNTGDNFYPAGVTGVDCKMWEHTWGQVYQGLPDGTPWYSVYGNHDYGQFNRPCACNVTDAGDTPGSTDGGNTCFQVMKHGQKHGGQVWYMPKASYAVTPLPGVKLRIVTLDMNIVDPRACTYIACGAVECHPGEVSGGDYWSPTYPGCTEEVCHEVFTKRAEAAARLVVKEVAKAEAEGWQLIINCHYPGSYLKGKVYAGIDIWQVLQDTTAEVLFFGAHVHSTDNSSGFGKATVDYEARKSGLKEYCVGGGGGWACDGLQGVVAGEVLDTGRIENLRFIMVSYDECCMNEVKGYWWK